MAYQGNIYGKIGDNYFPLDYTASDVEKMKSNLQMLTSVLHGVITESDTISSKYGVTKEETSSIETARYFVNQNKK